MANGLAERVETTSRPHRLLQISIVRGGPPRVRPWAVSGRRPDARPVLAGIRKPSPSRTLALSAVLSLQGRRDSHAAPPSAARSCGPPDQSNPQCREGTSGAAPDGKAPPGTVQATAPNCSAGFPLRPSQPPVPANHGTRIRDDSTRFQSTCQTSTSSFCASG